MAFKQKKCSVEGCDRNAWWGGKNPRCTLHPPQPQKVKTASKIVKEWKNRPAIAPISKKQAEKLKEYRKVRDSYLSIHRTCEVRECKRWATDLHHMAGRTGDLLIDTNYFMAVCRRCHTYIEEHPDWAKKEGYSVTRIDK